MRNRAEQRARQGKASKYKVWAEIDHEPKRSLDLPFVFENKCTAG